MHSLNTIYVSGNAFKLVLSLEVFTVGTAHKIVQCHHYIRFIALNRFLDNIKRLHSNHKKEKFWIVKVIIIRTKQLILNEKVLSAGDGILSVHKIFLMRSK